MNYIVYDGKFDFNKNTYSGKVFKTFKEACNYSNLIAKLTGKILPVEKTLLDVTHEFMEK